MVNIRAASPSEQQHLFSEQLNKKGHLTGKTVSLVCAGLSTAIFLTSAVVAYIYKHRIALIISAVAFAGSAIATFLIRRIQVSKILIGDFKATVDAKQKELDTLQVTLTQCQKEHEHTQNSLDTLKSDKEKLENKLKDLEEKSTTNPAEKAFAEIEKELKEAKELAEKLEKELEKEKSKPLTPTQDSGRNETPANKLTESEEKPPINPTETIVVETQQELKETKELVEKLTKELSTAKNDFKNLEQEKENLIGQKTFENGFQKTLQANLDKTNAELIEVKKASEILSKEKESLEQQLQKSQKNLEQEKSRHSAAQSSSDTFADVIGLKDDTSEASIEAHAYKQKWEEAEQKLKIVQAEKEEFESLYLEAQALLQEDQEDQEYLQEQARLQAEEEKKLLGYLDDVRPEEVADYIKNWDKEMQDWALNIILKREANRSASQEAPSQPVGVPPLPTAGGPPPLPPPMGDINKKKLREKSDSEQPAAPPANNNSSKGTNSNGGSFSLDAITNGKNGLKKTDPKQPTPPSANNNSSKGTSSNGMPSLADIRNGKGGLKKVDPNEVKAKLPPRVSDDPNDALLAAVKASLLVRRALLKEGKSDSESESDSEFGV